MSRRRTGIAILLLSTLQVALVQGPTQAGDVLCFAETPTIIGTAGPDDIAVLAMRAVPLAPEP